MEIRLELNQRFRNGFQVHFIHGPVSKVFDAEPFTLPGAGYHAGALLEAVNKEQGTAYQPGDVIRVPHDALEANAKTDFTAARMLQERPDVKMAVVDGENQPVISARGVVLLALEAWKEEGAPEAAGAMRRYCEYISAHGYRGGASKAMAELEAMGIDRGAQWVKQTFARYVPDEAALARYVLPQT